MLKLTDLRRPIEADEDDLPAVIAQRLKIAPDELRSWRILRRSLDARQRHQLQYVYTLQVELPEETRGRFLKGNKSEKHLSEFVPDRFFDPPTGPEPMRHRPVVIGSGPAGLLAGYYLARRGYRPLIIERGQPVKERVPAIRTFDRGGGFDGENNYLFGEGGAGAFSDGKLTCRMSGADVDYVLQRFVETGGKPSLVYEHRPHLGSNRLPLICRNFRRLIEGFGGEYRFGCRFEGLIRDGDRVVGIETSSGPIMTEHVILGIGHSARDTYRMLHESGVPMEAKAFQLGLRIEHPQEMVNAHKYGREDYLTRLGSADYSLVAKGRGGTNDLFTFCMCAGGVMIPSVSEPGMFCSNGMSNSRRDSGFANSGLVVTLSPEHFGSSHPLAGVEVQRQYERLAFELTGGDYTAPIQRADDYLAERPPDPGTMMVSSYERGTKPRDLNGILPPTVRAAMHAGLPIMNQKWGGSYLKDAVLIGPEMRGSSPVRIARDRETRECPTVTGLFPIGEGAGYAGGIVSAAVDGLRTARELVRRWSFAAG